ncbi:MAG: glycoside hydrolase [Coriobacteriaceae bacterium]|jgi:GH25 family lysozyme M1 (1,4-beta-N-acetylmuramidase)|nr:glycoside hydrolase [Coriobacteriaceae bacterium]
MRDFLRQGVAQLSEPRLLAAFLGTVGLLVILVVLGILLLGGGLSTCAPSEQPSTEGVYDAYVSPYDFANLQNEEGRLVYYENGARASKTGIDVSEHQKFIDWTQVAADKIDFAIIRLGNRGYSEGTIFLDDYYNYNIQAAREAGIPLGVYFFSQATTEEEAREEAAFVIEHLGGVSLAYPVVFDHEPVAEPTGRANSVSTEDMDKVVKAFCTSIESAGYKTMVYGNKKDIARFSRDAIAPYDIWFAEYGVGVPSARFDFTMWQYTNSAQVAGIDEPVDMNIEFIIE